MVKRSFGPIAVGLMALHDRAFFEHLLKKPREALEEMVREGKLTLTAADVDHVVRTVEEGQGKLTAAQGLAVWDQWYNTGHVDPKGWVINSADAWIDQKYQK